ncbi:2-octaprenyl-6-methoxyphenol hydroxylase [Dinoroseobacter shibae DFL 12 = DSM 16493]|jgi:2-octaprenyl-6-methoxyphenol hydroxylase|uniref:2-octaprenyl-6-methoxyphenol hydroxylase n=1 Tax=Dinoroseobacter shibae (strain DSM 16493 / NCIMB 14021 / DFL 12) TaxID=398580 RepID=A8LJY5_DINSH|nr:FAD-dependent monooxygenase [Dinoroseobacter shibae]ABV91811.1 2-octaprenyl-6-methoxyphenol hydroxylase [Dinoroseobacter shibae DFL 12 = DSM 16493]URF46791.1 FAD-dependent monooxygenase [Dinoroseobacter shibae]URF51102.1 FAD-dependent monooxygenase [Dinoroseobacter shibae]
MDNALTQGISKSMADFDSDILIVGGGLNGPTLALALAQAGLRSTVIDAHSVDRRADPAFDGRSYALALASQRMLAALGLWDGLEERAQPMLRIKVSDGRPGEGAAPWWMQFDHAEIEEGPMGFMVEDRYLRRALLAAMEECAEIAHLSETIVIGQQVDADGVIVTLADGTSRRGRLLVGCDGRASGTARRAGIGRTGWGYDQTALVCAVSHELPHEGTAHQFFMPGGPLAILPLPGNRSSIVWSERTAQAERFAALDDAAFLEALRPRFGDFLGEIALVGARFTYPLSLTLANAMVADRLALVGDAAHGVHPIAGQGLNLGFRDVGALAEVLADAARRGEDIAARDVLDRYARWRRFDTATLAVATDAVNRLFSNDNPLLRLGRDLGMGLVNALPGARRTFIREAAGLTGDVPRLLQGRPV